MFILFINNIGEKKNIKKYNDNRFIRIKPYNAI